LGGDSGFIESSGHVVAFYQDELYEMAAGRSGLARLQNFGVIFGYRQVVVYVEPGPTAENRVTTNTARTLLLVNNGPLPWADWAAEFRKKMPEDIKALVERKAAASSVADHSQSIRERLKQIRDLFKISRYRPAIKGELGIDGKATTRGGQPRRGTGRSVSTGSSKYSTSFSHPTDLTPAPCRETICRI
jgi:hypothetical protein